MDTKFMENNRNRAFLSKRVREMSCKRYLCYWSSKPALAMMQNTPLDLEMSITFSENRTAAQFVKFKITEGEVFASLDQHMTWSRRILYILLHTNNYEHCLTQVAGKINDPRYSSILIQIKRIYFNFLICIFKIHYL